MKVSKKQIKPINAGLKAWRFFRKLLNDDEKYFTIKNRREPIEIKGSEGGRYFLYPNGQVVVLGKSAPEIGKAYSTVIARPDVLSTIYIWITQKEKAFLKRWNCGNMNIFYERSVERHDIAGRDLQGALDNLTRSQRDQIRGSLYRRGCFYRHMYRKTKADKVFDFIKEVRVPLVILFLMSVFFVMLIPNLSKTIETEASTSPAVANLMETVVPLLILLSMVFVIMYTRTKMVRR